MALQLNPCLFPIIYKPLVLRLNKYGFLSRLIWAIEHTCYFSKCHISLCFITDLYGLWFQKASHFVRPIMKTIIFSIQDIRNKLCAFFMYTSIWVQDMQQTETPNINILVLKILCDEFWNLRRERERERER
ncbi:hypothetical protein ACJX0J_012974, partial [Zea mays]